MPNQPSRGIRHGAADRAIRSVAGIKTFVAAVLTTAAVVATTFPATGAAVTEAGDRQAGASAKAGNSQAGAVAGAVGPQAGAFVHPTGTQHAIVDEALRNGAVPPELALAVARVAPDGRYAARYAGDSGLSGRTSYRPRGVRRSVAWLERLYRRYGERWDLALSHYYGGPLARCEGRYVSHVHTASHVTDVMAWWRRYQEDPTLGDLVRRTRAMQARGARFAALDAGATPGAEHEEYDKHRSRRQGRSRSDRGGYVALPFVQGRFRSDDRPAYGAARAGRFN